MVSTRHCIVSGSVCSHVALGALLMILPARSIADVQLGHYTFDERAFVDEIQTTAGAPVPINCTINEDCIVGHMLLGGLQFDNVAAAKGFFTDNKIVNKVGIDLIVYEYGAVQEAPNFGEGFRININGMFVERKPVQDLTVDPGGQVFTAKFDLSEFGVPLGASIQEMEFTDAANQIAFPGSPEIAAAAGIHIAPVPSMSLAGRVVLGGLLVSSARLTAAPLAASARPA